MLIIAGASAKEYSTDWGKLGETEKNVSAYAKDKDAEAVVLFDKGKIHFVNNHEGFDIVFERQTRIKILSESAL